MLLLSSDPGVETVLTSRRTVVVAEELSEVVCGVLVLVTVVEELSEVVCGVVVCGVLVVDTLI